MIANEPGTKYLGNVTYIHPMAESHEQHGHSVLMRIDLEKGKKLKDRRLGVTVYAKVKKKKAVRRG